MKMKIEEIVVKDRQRKEYSNLGELAVSMHEHGLIQPIVVNLETKELIAGGRRLAAAKLLALKHPEWREVEVFTREAVGAVKMKELELEENLQRVDLSPTDRLEAIAELHRLKQETHGEGKQGRLAAGADHPDGWTQKDTADLVGKHPSGVGREIELGSMLEILKEHNPEIYAQITEGGEAKSVARIKRNMERLKSKNLRQASAEKHSKLNPALLNMIQHCKAVDGLKQLETGSVDLIYCDPPFGVLGDSLRSAMAERTGSSTVTYADKDDPLDIYNMLKETIPELYRVLADGGHFYMYCAVSPKDLDKWDEAPTWQNLAVVCHNAGFTVRPGPIVWCKDMPFGHTMDPLMSIPFAHESIIHAWKGKKRAYNEFTKLDYVIAAPPTRGREHIAQKPPGLHYDILKYSYVVGGTMLDAFVGSGSSLLVAVDLGMNVIGFDIDEASVNLARSQLAEKMERRKSLLADPAIEYTRTVADDKYMEGAMPEDVEDEEEGDDEFYEDDDEEAAFGEGDTQ